MVLTLEAHKCGLGTLTREALGTIGSGPNSTPPLNGVDETTDTRQNLRNIGKQKISGNIKKSRYVLKDAKKKHIQIQCSENIGRIYLDKKCGSSPRTWLVGKFFVKLLDGQTCVGQILHRLPR